MQGVGILLAVSMAGILMLIFRSSIETDPLMLDHVWRLMVGFGCVPAFIALYFRLTIQESPRYTADVKLDVQKANQHAQAALDNGQTIFDPLHPPVHLGERATRPNTWKDFRQYFFAQWKHFKVLFAGCVCWFLLDIAFYGLTLNQSMVLEVITPHRNTTEVYPTMWNLVRGNFIIALLGTVPGYDTTNRTEHRRRAHFTFQILVHGLLSRAHGSYQNSTSGLCYAHADICHHIGRLSLYHCSTYSLLASLWLGSILLQFRS